MAVIENSIDYILVNEGGYCDVPADNGGPTNYGITQATLSRWRKKPCSADDVKALSKVEAVSIYKDYYWMPLSLDKINDQNIATAIFDADVNFGGHVAVMFAQYACNGNGKLLEVDGFIGPLTLKAINSLKRIDFIEAFYEEVLEGYREIVKRNPSQGIFLHGWEKRAERLLSLISDIGDLH